MIRYCSIFVLGAAAAACSVPASATEADDVLELAEDAGRWIIGTDPGGAWPDDALVPDAVGYDLASGVAGKVVFLVGLYRATGDPEYRAAALRGADALVAALEEPGRFDGDPRRASLYAGIAGIGVALLNVTDIAPQAGYESALLRLVELLEAWRVADDNGSHWSERFNDLAYGDAGTVLFLAHYASRRGDRGALELAQSGALSLAARARREGNGAWWRFRRDREFNLPNFSHGTAGIAYVLATVGAATKDDRLQAAAGDGFEYLRSIAETDGGLLRIPYGWGSDDWDGLYELGWAHGIAGTAYALMRLADLGIGNESAERMLEQARDTLTGINLPGSPSAPFAEPSTPADLRFGRAGVLPLVSRWAAADDGGGGADSLRDALFRYLEDTAVRDGSGAHWPVDAPAFMGGGRTDYTGLFHGAAGIGLSLLYLHAALVGDAPYVEMPDYPF